MTYKTIGQLKTEIATNFADNTSGNIGADDARSILNNIADSTFSVRVFQASDITGTTDVTSELAAYILAAGNELVYIPEGRYLLRNLNVAGDVNVVASPRAIFVYEYSDAGEYRAIRQRNDGAAPSQVSILDIQNVIYFNTENTTRIRVSDASLFAKDDIIQIHSRNGLLNTALTDERRIGQAGKIAEVDTINDYIYLYGALEYVPYMTNAPVIRKFSTRKFSWEGGQFEANILADSLNSAFNDQGARRPAMEVDGCPEVKIRNVVFKNTWGQNIMLQSCPYSIVENCDFLRTPNLRLPSEPYTGKTGTFSSGSNTVTVSGGSTSSIFVGQIITATGIPANTRVTNYSHPTVTISNNTTASGSSTALTFEQKAFITNITKGSTGSQSGTTVTGSRVISMGNTTGMAVGLEVTGTGVPPGAYITDVAVSTSITISENCTANGTVTITVYPGLTVTVDNAAGLANSDFIYLNSISGMTELNNRFFRVVNLSGSTFQLTDYFGIAILNGAGSTVIQKVLAGVNYTNYSSSGTVQETSSGDTLLAYGVQLYATCCFSIVRNCRFQELRHAVTSDGLGSGTYSATEWYRYGHPCKVLIKDCYAFDTHGVAFDTHEEGLNWTFDNCHVFNANRGPYGQTSYSGTGFQDRSGSNLYMNCTATGGARGFRVSKSDSIWFSETRFINCAVINNKTANIEDGIGLIIIPEIATGTQTTKVMIDGFNVVGCGTGLETLSNVSNGSMGTALDITARGLKFTGVKVGFDVAPGVHINVTDTPEFDVTTSRFTGDHYVARMRGQATGSLTGGSKTNGSAVITGLSGTATNYRVGAYVSGSAIPSMARIKSIESASQITLDAACTATETSDVTVIRASSLLFLQGISIIENHEKPLRCVYFESDTNGTKYTYMPTNGVKLRSVGVKQRTFTNSNINTGSDVITITGHAYATGDAVRLKNVSGTFPSGLSEDTTYYVRNVSANTITLHDTAATAVSGSAVDITAAGSGTFSIQVIPNVYYRNSSSAPSTFVEWPEVFNYS